MAHYETIIFCDFDGTITTEETFVGTLMRVCEEKDLYYWFGKFQRGEITLRACTEKLFSLAPVSKWPAVEAYEKEIRFRDGFGAFLDRAGELGIPVVVISGGVRIMQEPVLAPYMDRIEGFYSCDLDISGTYMRFSSKYANDDLNMDKVRIMGMYEYDHAIAIGDQHSTDLTMAMKSDTVFARDDLASYLSEKGIDYYPWETFYDIIPLLG